MLLRSHLSDKSTQAAGFSHGRRSDEVRPDRAEDGAVHRLGRCSGTWSPLPPFVFFLFSDDRSSQELRSRTTVSCQCVLQLRPVRSRRGLCHQVLSHHTPWVMLRTFASPQRNRTSSLEAARDIFRTGCAEEHHACFSSLRSPVRNLDKECSIFRLPPAKRLPLPFR